jgi:hypothetical protein
MDFIQVIHALKTIKKHCQETPRCESCRLHSKNDPSKCGVCQFTFIPANWEFDLESEPIVPSIFK